MNTRILSLCLLSSFDTIFDRINVKVSLYRRAHTYTLSNEYSDDKYRSCHNSVKIRGVRHLTAVFKVQWNKSQRGRCKGQVSIFVVYLRSTRKISSDRNLNFQRKLLHRVENRVFWEEKKKEKKKELRLVTEKLHALERARADFAKLQQLKIFHRCTMATRFTRK